MTHALVCNGSWEDARLLLVLLDVIAVEDAQQAVHARIALAVAPALHGLAALRTRVVPARPVLTLMTRHNSVKGG